eukprot:TRINITY_DN7023_c0_g1_i4.p1 TRINITY_DN7023_c0_g1~~TRINITY_DN7023_c0_g1_i4.p1  ORF type:complete len:600 (-),score=86.75 TRINITY_DN7023_c0_g1_i4:663-2462(-)
MKFKRYPEIWKQGSKWKISDTLPTDRYYSQICNMISQICRPWSPLVVSEDSLRFWKAPSFSLPTNQVCWRTRLTHVAKVSVANKNDSPIATRFSHIARTEAKDALFDYLYSTRGFQFLDAEHMSNNSPAFLQNLLSKVGNGRDVRRSLSRYLRYHPINEFEPFLESLGLKPSEFSSLLPRNLMFLSDDDMLLENFHVLCNFGVPYSKIGKMYKEAIEIFRYDHGVLSSKLHAYEALGLSKPMVIKFVTCCPMLLIGGVDGALIRVLEELKCLGIECNWISDRLSDKITYDWNKILETLGFITEMGCSNNDFLRLLEELPEFLSDDSGRKIYVLVPLLLKLGLKVNVILALILKYPRVLAGDLSKNLWQAIHFMSELGMETEDIAKIVQTHPQALGSCSSLKKPKTVLSEVKVGWKRLCDMIKEDPLYLSSLASQSNIKLLRVMGDEKGMYLPEKITFLLKLGFVENSDEIKKAMKQFRGRGDRLQERFDCLVDAGLDCHDVSNMIKMAPSVLNQSIEVIEMKIDYLVNCFGYPLEAVIPFPSYLCYGIKRIKLRFSMCKWLGDRGVLRPMLPLASILACSEARFVKHQDGISCYSRLHI